MTGGVSDEAAWSTASAASAGGSGGAVSWLMGSFATASWLQKEAHGIRY